MRIAPREIGRCAPRRYDDASAAGGSFRSLASRFQSGGREASYHAAFQRDIRAHVSGQGGYTTRVEGTSAWPRALFTYPTIGCSSDRRHYAASS